MGVNVHWTGLLAQILFEDNRTHKWEEVIKVAGYHSRKRTYRIF